ncbi:hypothetical protein C8R43DRAFT_1035514 [Mycena crocata]|nr:hypothetical protein C8R43DRAFT_1035514 [Mycena crocata]
MFFIRRIQILSIAFLVGGRPPPSFTSNPPPPISTSSPTTQLIAVAPNSLFLENIAVRSSGELLLTSVMSPTLLTLNPKTINGTFDAVHTFPNSTGITGITEYQPGVFALVASMLNTTTRRATPGSVVIWKVDFNSATPNVSALGGLPALSGANGLTSLPDLPDILLAADSAEGTVWQLDACSGTARLALSDLSMQPGVPAPGLGINGLHVKGSYLHFTNSVAGTLSRVKLSVSQNGFVVAAGAVEMLAKLQPAGQAPDDFALDGQGRAWVTVHPGAVSLLASGSEGSANASWSQAIVAGNAQGNDTGLIQPTSAAFGRGDSVEAQMLYVTTSAGQVVKVDTRG